MPSKPQKKKEIVEGSTANEEDKLEECDDNNNTPFIQFLLQKIHTNRPSPYKLLGQENEDTFENDIILTGISCSLTIVIVEMS